ncbi:MAG: hypothetical protein JST81_13640 [Bacteroidetes bacterium]|nr:hypothetical protein [Bacteroidota bacterium]
MTLFTQGCVSFAIAQEKQELPENAKLLYWRTTTSDSGSTIIFYYVASCKAVIITSDANPPFPNKLAVEKKREQNDIPASAKSKFLTVKGTVSYEYFYRSRQETAVDPTELRQHTEKVYLHLLFKEKYPFNIAFTARQSNSPFFKNYYDPNIQFNPLEYTQSLKREAIRKVEYKLLGNEQLKGLDAAIKEEKEKYKKLKNTIGSGSTVQKIIDEREANFIKSKQTAAKDSTTQSLSTLSRNRLPEENSKMNLNIEKDSSGTTMTHFSDSIQHLKSRYGNVTDSIQSTAGRFKDSLNNLLQSGIRDKKDSITHKYVNRLQNDKSRLDSIGKRIDSLQLKYDSVRKNYAGKIAEQRKKIYAASSMKELEKVANEYGIQVDSTKGIQKMLAGIRQFNIGKSMLNYTELTAQNINITGLNIEYNPSWYAAIAVGKIEYRFRDFLNSHRVHNSQYIMMGRIGVGNVQKSALIFSVFKGKKDQSGYSIPDSLQNHINILGYAIEAILKKNEFTYISAEAAKSIHPYSTASANTKVNNGLWRFNDMSNLGINFKAGILIDQTQTQLSGFYRKTGENFQSFSLFSYNTNQVAWMARVDQSFLKKHIGVTVMLRQNDFTNPFTDKTFKSTTTFKTIILNIRFPKYPSISIGYFPGTQLYLVNRDKIRENAYYILNGSATYAYRLNKIAMSSSFIMNRYFNKATDSGFVEYKGDSYYMTQSFFLKRLDLQGGASYNKQPDLTYYTIESSVDVNINKFLKAGFGLKYNQLQSGEKYVGERASVSLTVLKLGLLQFQYDKSYLPTTQNILFPIESGRLIWVKTF